jgi:hypothetical protein
MLIKTADRNRFSGSADASCVDWRTEFGLPPHPTAPFCELPDLPVHQTCALTPDFSEISQISRDRCDSHWIPNSAVECFYFSKTDDRTCRYPARNLVCAPLTKILGCSRSLPSRIIDQEAQNDIKEQTFPFEPRIKRETSMHIRASHLQSAISQVEEAAARVREQKGCAANERRRGLSVSTACRAEHGLCGAVDSRCHSRLL